MADGVLEDSLVEYLAGLPEAERQEAFKRINTGLKLAAPPDDVDPPPPVVKLSDYLEREFDVPPFLVTSGQLCRGEITTTIGRAGKGKTTLLRNRLIRWSAGRALFDDVKESQRPLEPLKILLLENEGVAWDMQKKLRGLFEGAHLDPAGRDLAGENFMIYGDGGYSGWKADNDESIDKMRRALETHRPDVLALEPFRGIWRGEENDATAMEDVLDRLVELGSEYGCAIMLSHHARKSEAQDGEDWMSAARGSGVLEGKVAVMENFRAVGQDGAFRELSWSKSRYFPTQGALRMAFNPEDDSYSYVPESDIARAAKAVLTQEGGDWCTIAQVAEEIGESQDKARKALNELAEGDSVLKKNREGSYQYRLKTGDANDSEGSGLKGNI